jgi:hypothetical protein
MQGQECIMQKKRLLILVTCLALLVSSMSTVVASAAQATQASDGTFSTPEAAITAFFEGVTQGDFSKILQACAVNEISENFKFDRSIERLKAFVPYQEYAPAQYPLFVELNQAQIESRIASQVKIFAYSLLSSGDVDFQQTNIMEVDAAVSFMNEVDPARLSTLELKEIGLPNPSAMSSARYKENMLKYARVYGADDSTERVALFSFEQNDYYVGFTLFQYGENWKISSVNSPIANTSALGQPVKTTIEEFEAMTK